MKDEYKVNAVENLERLVELGADTETLECACLIAQRMDPATFRFTKRRMDAGLIEFDEYEEVK